MEQASSTQRRALNTAVAIGIGLRLVQFLWRQSYWRDESALLLNIIHKHASELVSTPLTYAPKFTQAAPPLFLLILKGTIAVAGINEYAMRAVPLLCGIAAMFLFARVCLALIGPSAAAWAVAFFALSDNLIFYCATVKPYSTDVLAAMILLYIARVARPDAAPTRRLAATLAAASVLLWISYASVFVAAAISAAMFWQIIRHNRNGWRGYLVAHAPFVASFIVAYLLCMHRQRDVHLNDLWASDFVDWVHPLSIFPWLLLRLWEMFTYCLWPVGGALIPAAVLGLWHLWKTQRDLSLLIVAPFVVALAASAAHVYPFSGNRLTLYLVPFELMLAGCGIHAAASGLRSAGRMTWQLAHGGVLVFAALLAARALVVPRSMGNARAVVNHLKSHRHPGEPIYVMRGVGEDFLLYWPNADGPVYLRMPYSIRIDDRSFWVAIAYKPRAGRKEYQQVLDQPGVREDTGRSLHTRGGDAVFFRRSDGSR